MADKTEARETDADRTDSAVTAPTQKSLWHYARLGVSVALLLVVVALAAVVIVIPKLSNAVPLTVLTSSMEPSLPPGTLIIVKPTDPDTLAVGDVVTYQIRSGEPEVITHRIISVTVGRSLVRVAGRQQCRSGCGCRDARADPRHSLVLHPAGRERQQFHERRSPLVHHPHRSRAAVLVCRLPDRQRVRPGGQKKTSGSRRR